MEPSANFPSIVYAVMAVAGGLTCLVAGGELLVTGATRLARRLGLSSLLIGLTVVAFGTSMPELFVSLSASFQHHTDLMVGNVVGSNIANIGLVLALCALVTPLSVRFVRIRRELYLVLLVSLFTFGLGLFGRFPRLPGLLIVGGLLLFTILSYYEAIRNKKNNKTPETFAPTEAHLAIILPMIGGGLLLLAYGSNLFIRGAADVGRYLGISELIIGLTLAAVGTSLPELASSFSAIRRRETALLVGNILGSNLFNLMMVMGSTAAITPFAFSADVIRRDLPVMVAFTLVLIPILKYRETILRRHGFFLLLAYVLYLVLLA